MKPRKAQWEVEFVIGSPMPPRNILSRTLGAAWRRSLGRFGAWRWRFGARRATARRAWLNTAWDRGGA